MKRALARVLVCVPALLVACVGDSTTTPDAGGKDSSTDATTSDVTTSDVVSDAPSDVVIDAGPPFPATLSGVVIWLDAQESSTLHTTIGKVTKWSDRSNFQHDAVAVTNHEPALGTDASKNLPIVKFSTSEMIIQSTQADTSLQFGSTQDLLVEIVMLNTADTSIILHDWLTTNPVVGLGMGVLPGQTHPSFGLNYTKAFVGDTVASLDGKLRLFGFQRTNNGTTLNVRDNGAQTNTGTTSVYNVSAVLPIHIGAFDSTLTTGQNYMTGAIAELVVVTGTITPLDLQALEQYLMTKWSLP